MATHNLSVVLTGNNTNLRSSLLAAGKDVRGFTNEVEHAGRTGATSGQLLKKGLAVGVLAVGAAMLYSVNQAAKFDTQLRNVQSLTKQTDAEIASLGTTLVGLSMELPQSAETLAAGFYDIASSGFQGADALKVLEASAMAASAGLTTTEVSAATITAVLNAYGLEAKDAADVSDILFKTVDLGVVSFEELSGTIGDVVGTAAAATVAIDEVGSAIATMTLSGIGANEAGTSLNRLIQSLLDPSEELAAALEGVGYQSGAQALKVDELNVVMEKLRVASGGNIETLLAWFPEIRAARGALALMSNEGKNYLRVAAGIQDEEARAEATRKALNEQMKAASVQWQLFINWINAGAITMGTKVLPATIGLMDAFKSLGNSVIPLLVEGVDRLSPFFESLVDVLGDVVKIGGTLWDAFAPFVAGLGAIAGLGIITTLNLIGEAVSALTGFLAENEGLVKAVALILASIYVPALLAKIGATVSATAANVKYAASFKALQAQEAMGALTGRLNAIKVGMVGLTTAMRTGTGVTSAFRGALNSIGPGLATGGAIIAVTAAVNAYSNEAQKAKKHGEEWAESFAGGFDPAKVSMSELEAEIQRLNGAADEMQEHANNAINPFLDDRLKTARDELRETAKPLEELAAVAKVIQDELGVTSERALDLAQDQEFMAGATNGATGEFDKEAAAALEAQDALSELDDQLKSMFDPLFGLQDSMLSLQEAQKAAAEATRDHGAASEEAQAANREAIRAAVDYQSAILNLKGAIADGNVDINDAKVTLEAWAAAGVITEEQARQAAAEFDGLAEAADNANAKDVVVTATADTYQAEQNLQRLAGAAQRAAQNVFSAITSFGSPTVDKRRPPLARASGGPVLYGFEPRGTDTVPAMLTPGEYVVRKQAVDRLGLSFMERINRFAGGGVVPSPQYLAKGGTAGEAPQGWDLYMAQRDMGELSDHTWRNYLLQRLQYFRKYSAEWMDARNRLEQFEKDRAETEDALFELGRTSSAKYEKILEARLVSTKSFTAEWVKAHKELQEHTEDAWDKIFNAADARSDKAAQGRQLEEAEQAVAKARAKLEHATSKWGVGDPREARAELAEAEERLQSVARSAAESQRDLIGTGKAGEAQWRDLARQAGFTTKEINALVGAYRRLNQVQKATSTQDMVRAEFARRGLSLTAGDTRGESGAQRVARIARELEAGLRTWAEVTKSIAKLPGAKARWGNLYEYAGGGITPAHIGKGDLIRYAEPETGGEAYIPRRGQHQRSMAILAEAASWYGAKVTPMAKGGILSHGYRAGGSGASAAEVRIILDPNGADRRIVEMLRHMIRVEGGGSVQVALGQGASR